MVEVEEEEPEAKDAPTAEDDEVDWGGEDEDVSMSEEGDDPNEAEVALRYAEKVKGIPKWGRLPDVGSDAVTKVEFQNADAGDYEAGIMELMIGLIIPRGYNSYY